jgi:hypothetical protein
MGNVVQFPKRNNAALPQSNEELRAHFNKNKKRFVNGVVDHYSSQLATKFAMHGFNLENEKFLRDFAFSVESLRSGLYRSIGVEHPFQELMDDVINQMESDGDLEVEYEDDEDPTELY